MAEDSNGRCEKSWNFYLQQNQQRQSVAVTTHCNTPLLVGHLLLVFTTEINTLLGKTGFVLFRLKQLLCIGLCIIVTLSFNFLNNAPCNCATSRITRLYTATDGVMIA